MAETELIWLIMTAASIGLIHTLAGPDHYAPFAAMGAARGWSPIKTCAVTLICGGGHLLGSVVLGFLGVGLGLALGGLEMIEALRGEIASWALLAFGIAYAAWGLRRAYKNKPHTHWHAHDGVIHQHPHTHYDAHAHVHDQKELAAPATTEQNDGKGGGLAWAPWSIFVIFVLGPCEPLIPVLMYPAAVHDYWGVAAVVAAFGATTLIAMTSMALIMQYGFSKIRFSGFERFGHMMAGVAIAGCGASMVFLGL